ncbi:MAG: hypothetical protein JXR97_06375 [Planctomycetes bacterium]|nr:hypothetical protein [Planctomycetota bacterium]
MKYFHAFILLAFFAATASNAYCADVEESWEKELKVEVERRIAQHIRALDTLPTARRQHMQALVDEASGENRKLLLSMLHDAMEGTNMQLQIGVADTLAEIGDEKSIPALTRTLNYSTSIDLRRRILALLPAFLIEDSKVRKEVLEDLKKNPESLTNHDRDILRQLPYRESKNEFDPILSRKRNAIEDAIAGQLDPVGTTIKGLDSRRDQIMAQRSLVFFCNSTLGETRAQWAEKWNILSSDIKGLNTTNLTDIINIQTMACVQLGNIGAEATTSTTTRFRRLISTERPLATIAAIRTIINLGEYHRVRLMKNLAAMRSSAMIDENELLWKKERIASAKRLLDLAFECAKANVKSKDPLVRAQAFRAAGVSIGLSEPADDEDKATAKRNAEIFSFLHKVRIDTAQTTEEKVALSEALALTLNKDAVQELASLAAHKVYSSEQSQQHDEYRIVAAAISALGDIAKSGMESAAEEAFTELLKQRLITRLLPGSPLKRKNNNNDEAEHYTISDLATHQLMQAANTSQPSLSDEEWLAEFRKTRDF